MIDVRLISSTVVLQMTDRCGKRSRCSEIDAVWGPVDPGDRANAVRWAKEILKAIDERWPSK